MAARKSASKVTKKAAGTKKPAAKKAAPKKAATKKAATRKASATKKPAAKKATARKAAPKKAAAKKAEATEPAAKKPAAKKAAGKGAFVKDIHMGHIFALKPRVDKSFRQDDLRKAKELLVDEAYESPAAAARALAEKALELTRKGPPKRGFNSR
jgi:hypothetical protein